MNGNHGRATGQGANPQAVARHTQPQMATLHHTIQHSVAGPSTCGPHDCGTPNCTVRPSISTSSMRRWEPRPHHTPTANQQPANQRPAGYSTSQEEPQLVTQSRAAQGQTA
jgi:hypothetical protein